MEMDKFFAWIEEDKSKEKKGWLSFKIIKSAVVLPAPEKSEMPDSLVCPKCGAELILRTAGQGANVGRKFYGCSNYPKCRYTRNAEEPVMFEAIHHIAIIGSDYDATRGFYVDTLGFKVVRENYRKERDDYKIDLVCGEQEIELFIIKDAPSRPSYPEACGLRHLAFRVDSVDEMVRVLNKKGIKTEPVRMDDYTHKKMTFFQDPDGLPLEIHE